MEVKLTGGGQVERLRGKLTSVTFFPSEGKSKTVSMVLKFKVTSQDMLEDDNLSYLSIDEAIEMIAALKHAIKGVIDNYE